MIDYHIHTSLCNHARGRMEDYVLKAIERGLSEICFMDHLTLIGEGSANTMSPKEVPLYFYAIQRLKDKYKKKLAIRSGLEVDFEESMIDQITKITQKYNFDAIGGSVHFSEGLNLASRKSREKVMAGDAVSICRSYIDKLGRMLDFDFFDIICHIDLPKKFMGKAFSIYPDIIPVLVKAADKKKAVEINTSGFYQPCAEFYPELPILEECNKIGVAITLGSDAHSPEETGRDINLALEMAKNAGYSEICAFRNRKADFISF